MYKLQNLSNSTINQINPINRFWQSILLLVTKPHIVNKRLTGTILIKLYKCLCPNSKDLEEFSIQINSVKYEEKSLSDIFQTIQLNEINKDLCETWSMFFEKNNSEDKNCLALINKLIPKRKIHCPYYELCFLGI